MTTPYQRAVRSLDNLARMIGVLPETQRRALPVTNIPEPRQPDWEQERMYRSHKGEHSSEV